MSSSWGRVFGLGWGSGGWYSTEGLREAWQVDCLKPNTAGLFSAPKSSIFFVVFVLSLFESRVLMLATVKTSKLTPQSENLFKSRGKKKTGRLGNWKEIGKFRAELRFL